MWARVSCEEVADAFRSRRKTGSAKEWSRGEIVSVGRSVHAFPKGDPSATERRAGNGEEFGTRPGTPFGKEGSGDLGLWCAPGHRAGGPVLVDAKNARPVKGTRTMEESKRREREKEQKSTHLPPPVVRALLAADGRGVELLVVLERRSDVRLGIVGVRAICA